MTEAERRAALAVAFKEFMAILDQPDFSLEKILSPEGKRKLIEAREANERFCESMGWRKSAK